VNLNSLKFNLSKSVQKLLKRDGLNPALRSDLESNIGGCLDHPYLPLRLKAYGKALDALGDSPQGKKLARCNSHRRCHSPVCPVFQQLAVNRLVGKLVTKFNDSPRNMLFFATIAARPCTDPDHISESINQLKQTLKDLQRQFPGMVYQFQFEVDLLTPQGLKGCPVRARMLEGLGWDSTDQESPVWAPHAHGWICLADPVRYKAKLRKAFKISFQTKLVPIHSDQATVVALALTGSYMVKHPLTTTDSEEVFEQICGIPGVTGYHSRFETDMTTEQVQAYLRVMTKLNNKLLGFGSRMKPMNVRFGGAEVVESKSTVSDREDMVDTVGCNIVCDRISKRCSPGRGLESNGKPAEPMALGAIVGNADLHLIPATRVSGTRSIAVAGSDRSDTSPVDPIGLPSADTTDNPLSKGSG
jgi:hypothetical protein